MKDKVINFWEPGSQVLVLEIVSAGEDLWSSLSDTRKDPKSMQSLLFIVLEAFALFERNIIVECITKVNERANKQEKHMGRN